VRARFHAAGVKSDGLAMSALRMFYPCEPTFIGRGGMSQRCQKATLLNYFVGGDEKRLRHVEAECLGRFEVEH
jgi:hypothetical protein